MFIDTHAHLNYPEIVQDIEAILDRAAKAGIEYIIVPATNYLSSLEVIELVQKYKMLYGAIGIHPTELTEFHENQLYEIDKLAKSDKIVAIGEIGLDYYRKPYNKDLEQYVLKAQIQIAKNNNLPVILHNRESSDDLIKIIDDEYNKSKFNGQFHSFSGDMNMAIKCIAMSFYISFTGNITYKPNDKTRSAIEILKNIPIDKILLETDTPFLPPVPYRGKQNEPSYLIKTAEKIAGLKEININELGNRTSANAKILFGI
jgi:TatD DNase family protein